MGYNTTVVILNDALADIAGDRDFSARLVRGIMERGCAPGRPQSVSAGNHCNPATIIETHHADDMIPVLVGCNSGRVIEGVSAHWRDKTPEESILRMLADKLGYRLTRKGKP